MATVLNAFIAVTDRRVLRAYEAAAAADRSYRWVRYALDPMNYTSSHWLLMHCTALWTEIIYGLIVGKSIPI